MSTPWFARHWRTWRTPHLPTMSSALISSNAWARSSGVDVFLRTLTIPSLFRNVVNVRFLCAKSLGCHVEVYVEDIPYIKLRELFIQSYKLLIATETAPILLSTELFKCSSQLVVRRVLKRHQMSAPQRYKKFQAIHFLTPYWLLPLRLDILKAADTREMKCDLLL